MNLNASVAGPEASKVLQVISRWDYWGDPPQVCSFDGDEVPAAPEWVEQLQICRSNARAFWPNYRKQLGINKRSDLVFIGAPGGFSSFQEALDILEPLPFEVCALGATFFDEWIAADYRRWGFGRSMIDHGWGCMFRGAGHDRLVSRRWLDFGPWRVLRRPNDTTFIQFHDLTITNPAEAYEQAKVGHERMGNAAIGGYIPWHIDGLLKGAGKGIYTPEDRLLEVVVGFGNEVKQSEMLCNAALRLHHRTARSSTPVERVAYVFVDEADAQAHLHELWLRELECWVVDDKGKRRLDLDYHPVPSPPAWVTRLDGR
jgi:hypothetical protein